MRARRGSYKYVGKHSAPAFKMPQLDGGVHSLSRAAVFALALTATADQLDQRFCPSMSTPSALCSQLAGRADLRSSGNYCYQLGNARFSVTGNCDDSYISADAAGVAGVL